MRRNNNTSLGWEVSPVLILTFYLNTQWVMDIAVNYPVRTGICLMVKSILTSWGPIPYLEVRLRADNTGLAHREQRWPLANAPQAPANPPQPVCRDKGGSAANLVLTTAGERVLRNDTPENRTNQDIMNIKPGTITSHKINLLDWLRGRSLIGVDYARLVFLRKIAQNKSTSNK